MCIIIDTNTLASVLEPESVNHSEFKPVYDWIKNGKGVIVYGGTKYKKELGKYLPIFVELRKATKAIGVDDSKVDQKADEVSTMIQHANFDDQHLIGLLIQSQCKLICSLDSRAYPYFRHSLFFKPAANKPKIYRGSSNKDLLTDRNIAEICKPCLPTTVAQKNKLSIFNR
ncbi:MAG: hypothetical protein J0L80_12295 [Chitinophagales bacterium]|nr:hypothetical protein [Chitinophagales bacterium]